MDQIRAETLEALQQFLESQNSFLERTQSDIARLKRLRAEAAANPDEFCSNLSEQLGDTAYKLSSRLQGFANAPDVEWSVYAGRDPTPLKVLANDARPPPYLSQRSELSELQTFVKSSKCRIIDPVIDKLTRSGCFDVDEDEQEIDFEALKNELELERLMKLKKRKLKCGGLTISISARVPTDVVVRRDIEDESGHVDISLDDDQHHHQHHQTPPAPPSPSPPLSASASIVPPTAVGAAASSQPSKSTRVRRVSAKVKEQELALAEARPCKKRKLEVKLEDTPPPPPPATTTTTKRSRDAGKPKPETYKQAWSTSEQHLLEKLLEDIPDGEKNRWQKISQAMNGRRTPRQVASRVQKYFEKLKRFGIGVNGS